MTEKQENFLSYDELKQILQSKSPVEVADIISPYFEDIIIYHNNKCYKINTNMVYEDITKGSSNILLTDVSKFILKSFLNLSKKN